MRAHAPRLVVIDVQLACANGIDVVSRIKACAPDTDIVIFTLHDAAAYRAAATRAGACGYVLKPRVEDLLPLLGRLLDGTASPRRNGAGTPHLFTTEPGQRQET